MACTVTGQGAGAAAAVSIKVILAANDKLMIINLIRRVSAPMMWTSRRSRRNSSDRESRYTEENGRFEGIKLLFDLFCLHNKTKMF